MLASLACGLASFATPTPAAAQGVRVALTPAQQTVAPGSEFDVDVQVTQAGSAFNGFTVVVAYDPAALTFVPLAPLTSQQGCLMTGGCSAACGNTFHEFAAGGDSVRATSVLVCNLIALSGPGQVYRLRFRASNTLQITELSFRQARFVNAGLLVTPVLSTGCRVGIGISLDAPTPATTERSDLSAEPNPSSSRVGLTFAASAPGVPDIAVVDVLGRTVRRLEAGRLDRGTHRVVWDGRDDSGQRLPAGVYLVRLRMNGKLQQTRVTLLR